MELNRAIYEIPKNRYLKVLDELVELLEVKKLLKIQVRRLSLGQRMRLELIAALLHEPKVLFLDEPTNGLDPTNAMILKDMIREFRANGGTVFVTSRGPRRGHPR